MAYSKISLFSCFLAFLLISNGVSARILGNLVAMINLDAEEQKVTQDKPEVRAESSFSLAPASAPALQPSQLSQAKEEHAPAPAPDNQFPSIDVKPSTDAATDMGTKTKTDCNNDNRHGGGDDDDSGDGK